MNQPLLLGILGMGQLPENSLRVISQLITLREFFVFRGSTPTKSIISWLVNVPPPEIAGLMIRAYENPLVSLNKALLSPYFWGGFVWGGVG